MWLMPLLSIATLVKEALAVAKKTEIVLHVVLFMGEMHYNLANHNATFHFPSSVNNIITSSQ